MATTYRQINDVRSLISRNVDVIVIVPHDGDAMAQGVRAAHEAGIPVIAYDRLIKNCDLDIYLSFDNVKVGRLQAQWILDHLPTPGKGRIVIANGSKTDNNAFLFHQGAMEVFQPYIDRAGTSRSCGKTGPRIGNSKNAKKIVNAAISKLGPNGFDAVLAPLTAWPAGAIQALSEEGLAGKILVTGQDAEIGGLPEDRGGHAVDDDLQTAEETRHHRRGCRGEDGERQADHRHPECEQREDRRAGHPRRHLCRG